MVCVQKINKWEQDKNSTCEDNFIGLNVFYW